MTARQLDRVFDIVMGTVVAQVYRTETVNSLDSNSEGADTEAPRASDCDRVDGEFAFLFSSLKVDPVAEFRIEDALPRIIVVGPK